MFMEQASARQPMGTKTLQGHSRRKGPKWGLARRGTWLSQELAKGPIGNQVPTCHDPGGGSSSAFARVRKTRKDHEPMKRAYAKIANARLPLKTARPRRHFSLRLAFSQVKDTCKT